MEQLAEACGFIPRLCRPYRAKTKGKVERFNAYLKGSFVVPLAATLEASGLRLDARLANVHVRRWLDEVANVRVHATSRAVPAVRLAEERAVMLAAPALKAELPERQGSGANSKGERRAPRLRCTSANGEYRRPASRCSGIFEAQ